jgi:hypothetical protein
MTREFFNLSNKKDLEEVRRLLEDDEDDPAVNEDFGEESDIDSHDEVEERKDNSETEQDGEVSDDENGTELESNFLGEKIKLPNGPKILRLEVSVRKLIML